MSNPTKKITIHEVAALAGVSAMTVTRVMSNASHVAATTRETVLNAIKSLNYEPRLSARNLSRSYSRVIGLVVAPVQAEQIESRAGYEYLNALYIGAVAVCNERDYGLMVLEVSDAASIERLVRSALSCNIGGYIVAAPMTETPQLIKALRDNAIAHATINPLLPAESSAWVVANDRKAIRELTLHLGAMGHKSIAYVGTNKGSRACKERLAGYKDGLRRLNMPVRKEWLTNSGITFEDGLAAGRQLLNLDIRPSAVQCASDDLAAGVIAAAHERGMLLPQELSVTGFDDFGVARKTWPSLTTARLPVEEMVAHATMQVIGALEGNLVESKSFICPLKFRMSVHSSQE